MVEPCVRERSDARWASLRSGRRLSAAPLRRCGVRRSRERCVRETGRASQRETHSAEPVRSSGRRGSRVERAWFAMLGWVAQLHSVQCAQSVCTDTKRGRVGPGRVREHGGRACAARAVRCVSAQRSLCETFAVRLGREPGWCCGRCVLVGVGGVRDSAGEAPDGQLGTACVRERSLFEGSMTGGSGATLAHTGVCVQQQPKA